MPQRPAALFAFASPPHPWVLNAARRASSARARGRVRLPIIQQGIEFPATPHRLYEAPLDSKQFAAFSRRAAEIDPTVGDAFSLFIDHIIGRNLGLIPGARMVQAWRVVPWGRRRFASRASTSSPPPPASSWSSSTPRTPPASTTTSPRAGRPTTGLC